ncbi:MAG: hypothetical protein ACPGID_04330 [Rubricella sp.]
MDRSTDEYYLRTSRLLPDPLEFVSLFQAFQLVGTVLFREDWTSMEALAERPAASELRVSEFEQLSSLAKRQGEELAEIEHERSLIPEHQRTSDIQLRWGEAREALNQTTARLAIFQQQQESEKRTDDEYLRKQRVLDLLNEGVCGGRLSLVTVADTGFGWPHSLLHQDARIDIRCSTVAYLHGDERRTAAAYFVRVELQTFLADHADVDYGTSEQRAAAYVIRLANEDPFPYPKRDDVVGHLTRHFGLKGAAALRIWRAHKLEKWKGGRPAKNR